MTVHYSWYGFHMIGVKENEVDLRKNLRCLQTETEISREIWISSFSRVRLVRSLVLCVCFEDCCLSFCPFSFCHCVICPSIHRFWLPLWYLQTLLEYNRSMFIHLYAYYIISFAHANTYCKLLDSGEDFICRKNLCSIPNLIYFTNKICWN